MCIIDIARTEGVTLNLLAIIGHQNYVSKTTDNNCENLQTVAIYIGIRSCSVH